MCLSVDFEIVSLMTLPIVRYIIRWNIYMLLLIVRYKIRWNIYILLPIVRYLIRWNIYMLLSTIRYLIKWNIYMLLSIVRYLICQNISTLLPTDCIHLRFLDYHTVCQAYRNNGGMHFVCFWNPLASNLLQIYTYKINK